MVTPKEARNISERLHQVSTRCDDHYSLDRSAACALTDLAAQVESLQADAERYRWLRKRSDLCFSLGPTTDWCGGFYPDALDESIDAARKDQP